MDMPPNKISSKGWYSSTKILHLLIHPLPQLQFPTQNCSSLPILISLCHHTQAHHIQSIPDCHHPRMKKMKKTEVTTNLGHPLQKKDCSQGPSLVKNGSEICKGWNPWLTIAYQGWQVGKSSPPSSATTLFRTIQRSYSPMGTTALTTRDHSTPDLILIPTAYSHERRPTPSIPMRPSHWWSTSPSMTKETPLYEEKSNASGTPITEWQTLPKTWQNLKNSIGTHDGRSTTPSACWPVPMLTDDLNCTSSMMPQSPPIFLAPCLTWASTTLPTGGNTAQTTKMPPVDGVRIQDIWQNDAPNSPNVSSAMAQDILKCTVAILINAAETDGSAESRTITLVSPTPPVPQTLGLLDDRKDVEWGIMSREMLQHHMTQRGDSPLFLYDLWWLESVTHSDQTIYMTHCMTHEHLTRYDLPPLVYIP